MNPHRVLIWDAQSGQELADAEVSRVPCVGELIAIVGRGAWRVREVTWRLVPGDPSWLRPMILVGEVAT
jgi:hypothetical protein